MHHRDINVASLRSPDCPFCLKTQANTCILRWRDGALWYPNDMTDIISWITVTSKSHHWDHMMGHHDVKVTSMRSHDASSWHQCCITEIARLPILLKSRTQVLKSRTQMTWWNNMAEIISWITVTSPSHHWDHMMDDRHNKVASMGSPDSPLCL